MHIVYLKHITESGISIQTGNLFKLQTLQVNGFVLLTLHKKKLHKSSLIKIPILLLRSSSSVYGNRWTKDFNRGDAILNVNDISKYGKKLGQNVHEVVCPNGLHDLVLSNNDTRNFVYSTIFNWIKRHGFCHKSFRQS